MQYEGAMIGMALWASHKIVGEPTQIMAKQRLRLQTQLLLSCYCDNVLLLLLLLFIYLNSYTK